MRPTKKPQPSPHARPLPLTRAEREIAIVQEIVAEYYGYKPTIMTDPGRAEPVATIRQVAMVICRNVVKASFPTIARLFAKKDHGTVIFATEAIRSKRATEPRLDRAMDELTAAANKRLHKPAIPADQLAEAVAP